MVTTASAARPSLAAQSIRPGRPRVDDGDHAVDGGDPCEPGTDGCGDGGVVDIDAVGDDGDLAPSFGELVEPCGDAAGFGARSGAEARGEHREGRAADGAGADEYDEPDGDDGTSAAHDQ